MTNNSIPSSVYIFQFNDGNYLSWYDVNSHYTFGTTSTITQAAMFDSAKDVPGWINNYLGGTLKHISLEVIND
ncbi:hypothetical protein FXE12_12280 [Lactobacillus sp. SL9-6]|nr:hypothetical protein FXE12_12280 [Lactobacillus sp. SL9-6]